MVSNWKIKSKKFQQLQLHKDIKQKYLLMVEEATMKMDNLRMEIKIILKTMKEKTNKMTMI